MSKEVINLAISIANARDSEIPLQLLKIQDLLNNSSNLSDLVYNLFKYDILTVLSVSFKNEYGFMREGWGLAVDLLRIYCECIKHFDAKDKQFENELLPQSCQNILLLARRFQEKHLKLKGVATSGENLKFFDNCMKNFYQIHIKYPQLVLRTLRSPRFFQLFVTDELDTSVIYMNTLNELIKIRQDSLSKLEEKTLYPLMDEIIYKYSTSNLLSVGVAATQLLVSMCQLDRNLIRIIYRRYKGLKILLSKWYGKGIGKELNDLIRMIDTADQTKTEDEREAHYATLIQKTWRGYCFRKKFKQTNKALIKFQRIFRRRRQIKQEQEIREQEANEMRYRLAIAHTHKMRERKLEMREILEIIPANQIEKYFERQRVSSAIKIQAWYRGNHQRRLFKEQRGDAVRYKSAVIIQRAFRRWLKRQEYKRDEHALYTRPNGLTQEKREELLERIRIHLDTLPNRSQSDQEFRDSHAKAQSKFMDYVRKQTQIRKQKQQIQVHLAMANHDSELLINCPKLHEITEDDINNYYSHKSVPVLIAAKEEHKRAIKKAKSNWYELLHDSDSDLDLNVDLSGVTRVEKERLKTNTISKRNSNIKWFDNE